MKSVYVWVEGEQASKEACKLGTGGDAPKHFFFLCEHYDTIEAQSFEMQP